MTLLTNVKRGKAARGRLYAPTAAIRHAYGVVSASEALALATRTHDLIAAINAAMPAPAAVSIISTTGQSNHVVGTSVGRILDTLRTRRRSLVESPYQKSPADL